ncbi:MAG: DUF2189 domain-containing protein [Roseinatronobacter sp.]
MSDTSLNPLSPALATRSLSTEDLKSALSAGFADFMAAPIYGLFFAACYVAGGLALWFGLVAAGQPVWFLPIAAGFPLLAPFAAVGLYEVSRRREAGEKLSWGPILGALNGKGDGQLALMSVGVLLVFGFWVILARGIFAIFLAESGIGFDNLAALSGPSGVSMLLVGTIVGGIVAFFLFAVTVISLPMLLDREVDFVTAMATSVAAVQANPQVMLTWAGMIAGLLALAMLPAFIGLFIVLPVLGHATWHLYRRAVAG